MFIAAPVTYVVIKWFNHTLCTGESQKLNANDFIKVLCIIYIMQAGRTRWKYRNTVNTNSTFNVYGLSDYIYIKKINI